MSTLDDWLWQKIERAILPSASAMPAAYVER